ncbi:MAG TPA: TlpA disulfide reductase family protein [Casimicrobiaceae bacterium]|nr:TlpA disulfide reductase family protein [Casimicrobiaceae bacterium]
MVQVTAGNAPGAAATIAPEVAQQRSIVAALRHRWRLAALALALAIAALALGMGAALHRGGGDPARDGAAVLGLVLPDVNGKPQALAQWRGKVLIVNFWATWCAPCREEMPQFVAAQAHDGAKGVQFVGIAVDDPAKVEAYAREIHLNYPALIGGFGAIELSKMLGNDLAALPFTIVLDRQGRVAHTQLGPLKSAKLDDLLRRLLPAG